MDLEFATSAVAEIDRKIEDAMGQIMTGQSSPGTYGYVSDLTARRVEITEPEVFARLERLLKVLDEAA